MVEMTLWAVVQQGMLDAAKELGCQVDIDLAGSDLALQQKDLLKLSLKNRMELL